MRDVLPFRACLIAVAVCAAVTLLATFVGPAEAAPLSPSVTSFAAVDGLG